MENYNHIPQAIEAMKRTGREITKKGAFDVAAAMQSLAAVATGFMRSAIYTETVDGSTYGQGAGGAHLEPPLNGDTENGQVAWAVAGADYSIFVNNGTVHQAAQPFIEPAADQVQPSYEAAWEKLNEAMRV